jgi:hypothetical protein
MLNRNGLGERDLKTRRGIQAVDSCFVWSVILWKFIFKIEDMITCASWSDLIYEAIYQHDSVISGSLKMYNLISWMNVKGFNLQFKYIFVVFKMLFWVSKSVS